jgi:hypothetical protein
MKNDFSLSTQKRHRTDVVKTHGGFVRLRAGREATVWRDEI